MNVEGTGREEKYFVKLKGVFLLLFGVLTSDYPFYGMCILQIICNMFCSNVLNCHACLGFCFGRFNLCVQLIMCSFFGIVLGLLVVVYFYFLYTTLFHFYYILFHFYRVQSVVSTLTSKLIYICCAFVCHSCTMSLSKPDLTDDPSI